MTKEYIYIKNYQDVGRFRHITLDKWHRKFKLWLARRLLHSLMNKTTDMEVTTTTGAM